MAANVVADVVVPELFCTFCSTNYFLIVVNSWHFPIDIGWLWELKWLHVQDKLDYLCTLNPSITIGCVGKWILVIPVDNCQMCRWHIPNLKRIVCCTFSMNFIGFYSIFHWTWAIINNATQVINTSYSPKNQSIIIFQVGGLTTQQGCSSCFLSIPCIYSTMVPMVFVGGAQTTHSHQTCEARDPLE